MLDQDALCISLPFVLHDPSISSSSFYKQNKSELACNYEVPHYTISPIILGSSRLGANSCRLATVVGV
jgi:hypothetical protein